MLKNIYYCVYMYEIFILIDCMGLTIIVILFYYILFYSILFYYIVLYSNLYIFILCEFDINLQLLFIKSHFRYKTLYIDKKDKKTIIFINYIDINIQICYYFYLFVTNI